MLLIVPVDSKDQVAPGSHGRGPDLLDDAGAFNVCKDRFFVRLKDQIGIDLPPHT